LGRAPVARSEGGRLLDVEKRVDVVGGETRYARPWRPVKPLLIMEVVGMRSRRHFEQWRCEGPGAPRKEVGWVGGEDDGVEVGEAERVELELRRRRKGIEGRR
jgi:hypothetical protein